MATVLRTQEVEQELFEAAVARVNDELARYTLAFRRKVLQEALKRISKNSADAETAEIDAQMDVLVGRRPGMIAGIRTPESIR